LQTVIREACERHDLIVQRKELLRELEATNKELRQANELKSAFIQVASHELRTPLAIAMGFAELAARRNDVPPPLNDYIDRAKKALARLSELVNQITTMLEAGQFDQRLSARDVELTTIVRDAVEDVRPFVAARNQKIVENVPQSLGSMKLDVEKIRDAVNHIVLNAVKFTPDEGTVTVSAERSEDGGAVIRVSDTGCGIDPAHLPKIGQAFFTGFDVARHSTGKFEHGKQGLALGLSVVKAFVEMHGGKLAVESQLGCGTSVTITLPAQTASAPAVSS
jgi:signal transduction histidine kinase